MTWQAAGTSIMYCKCPNRVHVLYGCQALGITMVTAVMLETELETAHTGWWHHYKYPDLSAKRNRQPPQGPEGNICSPAFITNRSQIRSLRPAPLLQCSLAVRSRLPQHMRLADPAMWGNQITNITESHSLHTCGWWNWTCICPLSLVSNWSTVGDLNYERVFIKISATTKLTPKFFPTTDTLWPISFGSIEPFTRGFATDVSIFLFPPKYYVITQNCKFYETYCNIYYLTVIYFVNC